jgi:ParB family chromosome partitioning protein
MTSTSGKNRSLLASLVAPAPVTETPTPSPAPAPATGAAAIARAVQSPAPGAVVEPPPRLQTRMSSLARMASGDIKEKTLKLVDPARCRIWARHNRRYDLLNAENCAELLEGLRSQGQQELPALVRPVTDDPNFDYEVIWGARRHWSVSYLRTVEHRDIKYLVEERELTDEQAFRLSDIENRSRADLCDYERAVDYLKAVNAYYDGQAQRMADRLEVSKSWLSRFLDLGRLPSPVVSAFGDIFVLKVNHARQLKAFLEGGPVTDLVLDEAERLTAQQREHQARKMPLLDPAKVVQALQKAAGGSAPHKTLKKRSAPNVISNPRGEALFTLKRKGPKLLVLEISLDTKGSEADLVEAFRQEVAKARQ